MQTMDVRYINPFLSAVGLVFRTMADMTVNMGKPYLKDMQKDMRFIYTVAATIELQGSTTGIVSMRFCRPVVLVLVKALTGELPKDIDDNCLDALGEVANMVVGNAKKDFPLSGTTIGTPKVVRTDPLEDPPILVMPFDCSAGRFLIEARLACKPVVDARPQPTSDLSEANSPESIAAEEILREQSCKGR
jgi:chemotaxis protein CheX